MASIKFFLSTRDFYQGFLQKQRLLARKSFTNKALSNQISLDKALLLLCCLQISLLPSNPFKTLFEGPNPPINSLKGPNESRRRWPKGHLFHRSMCSGDHGLGKPKKTATGRLHPVGEQSGFFCGFSQVFGRFSAYFPRFSQHISQENLGKYTENLRKT